MLLLAPFGRSAAIIRLQSIIFHTRIKQKPRISFDNRGLFREQLLLFCFRALIKAKSFGTFPVRLVTKDLPLPAQRKLNFDQNGCKSGCKWVLFGRIIAERSREGGSLKGRIKTICHRYSYQLFWLISWQLLSRVFDRTSLNQCRWRSYWMNK